MKTLFRCLLALMLLMEISAAQAQALTVPQSAIKDMTGTQCLTYNATDNTLSMTDCDLQAHQTFTFAAWGGIYSPLGHNCLNGSFPPANQVSMGPCAQLTASWWRPGSVATHKIHFAGDTQQCLTRVAAGFEMEDCLIDNTDQDWKLDGTVPLDWPFDGRSYIQSKVTVGCIKNLNAGVVPGATLVMGDCQDQYVNEYFDFLPDGTIRDGSNCLTAGRESSGAININDAAADSLTYETCNGSLNQRWVHDLNFLVSQRSDSTARCVGIAGNSTAPGAQVTVQTCAPSNLFQQWDLSMLSANWPTLPYTPPSTAVPGATLTGANLESVVDWIQSETSISTTPFCYKPPGYYNGIGITPSSCGDGQQNVNGTCYDKCRDGFSRGNPPVPTCGFTGTLSYLDTTHCNFSIGGVCIDIEGDSCRDGYTNILGFCTYTGTLAYTPPMGPAASCNSNREKVGILCMLKPRPGYTCDSTLTTCTLDCPSGTSDCGPAACATSSDNCTSAITDMVLSSAQLLAFIGTEGASGAVKVAFQGVKLALEGEGAVLSAESILRGAINDFMNLAENNLASISTQAVADSVARGYVLGSPNYKHIAREWASRLLITSILDLQLQLANFMITSLDPTGVYGVVSAFQKPTCQAHTTMPQY